MDIVVHETKIMNDQYPTTLLNFDIAAQRYMSCPATTKDDNIQCEHA
jgi:hypothetical protein